MAASSIKNRIVDCLLGIFQWLSSAAKTSPSAPSITVLTTSLTLARLGDTVVTMDSRRLVATKTGLEQPMPF